MTNRTIAELVSYLESLDVQLSVEEDSLELALHKQNTSPDQIRLRCNAPEGILTTELRQELADRKAELVLYLHQQKAKDKRQKAENSKDNEKSSSPIFPTPPHPYTPTPLLPSPSPNNDYGSCINSHPAVLSTMCLLQFAYGER